MRHALVLLAASLGAGCGFDIQTPPIRLEFLDATGRDFRPKEAFEVVVNARISARGAAAEVFDTRTVKLSATRPVLESFRLSHGSGSDPSLEILMPDDGAIVGSDEVLYDCRPSVQVTTARLESTREIKLRIGCTSQPNRIDSAAFVCDGAPYLEVRGTLAELRKVAGAVAFTDDIAATMRAKLRFTNERAPFAEIMLQFSRTNVIAGVADAKYIVKAVGYTMPAARDFTIPDVLDKLERGLDAGFAASENPNVPDEVGKVMQKTHCRGDQCRLRFLWPVIPTDRREVEVSVHIDRGGRRDPSFRVTAEPCEAPAPEEGGSG